MRHPWVRAALAFLLFTALAYLLLVSLRRDQLPVEFRILALQCLFPGYLLRGLASGSELGFGDVRDTALLLSGSAGTFALVFATLDVVVRKSWHRLRAVTHRG